MASMHQESLECTFPYTVFAFCLPSFPRLTWFTEAKLFRGKGSERIARVKEQKRQWLKGDGDRLFGSNQYSPLLTLLYFLDFWTIWVTFRGCTYRQGDCFKISILFDCIANSHRLEDLNTHQHFLRQLANLVDKPYQQYYSWLVESIINLLDVQFLLYMMLTLSIIFNQHLHPCSFPQIFKRKSHIMVFTKIHKSCSGWYHSKACHKYAFS